MGENKNLFNTVTDYVPYTLQSGGTITINTDGIK